jgi:hypothetical protein
MVLEPGEPKRLGWHLQSGPVALARGLGAASSSVSALSRSHGLTLASVKILGWLNQVLEAGRSIRTEETQEP